MAEPTISGGRSARTVMHAIEHQLHLDHLHISQVLRCFERALEGYRQRGDTAEYLALILEALDYIAVYPQRWHHPVEDRIYALLQKRAPAVVAEGLALSAEHQRLEQLTAGLSALFTAVANDCMVPMAHLMRTAEAFVVQQNAHLERENRRMFPLLAHYLGEADWQNLEREFGQSQDPLFGERLRHEYDHLRASILTLDRNLQMTG